MLYILATSMVQVKTEEAFNKQSKIVETGKMIANEKEATEEALTNALQPLKAAKLALIDFDKSEIVALIETEAPPDSIEIVGECFVILKGIRDVSWKSVRTVMAEECFFKSLMEMNCDVITLKQLSQCKNHLKVS